MTDLLRFCISITRALLPLAALAAVACQHDDASVAPLGEMRDVPVQIGVPSTRAFANDQTHHVDRVLIIPFRKTAENLTNDNVNFVPAYSYAQQTDVAQFPLNPATLHLPTGVTFKVLVIGYNHADFDFNAQANPANRFTIGAAANPVTLANFHLAPKSPTIVPEFFTAIANVYNLVIPVGTTFRAEQGYTLSADLKRLVSGLSITISNVPSFVRSITLTAENLVKASRATDAAATQWQTTGDGGNRILDKKSPVAGVVAFTQYLLPTFATYKTGLTLTVELGSSNQVYTIKAADGPAVSGNKFIFNPNEAINLTGSYSTINLGFDINHGINLDDDIWDGIQ